MVNMLQSAKEAKVAIASLSAEQKNLALEKMASALLSHADQILAANEQDLQQASNTISPVMLDRLRLTEERILGMADGIRAVAKLPDPVGKLLDEHIRADGLLKVAKAGGIRHFTLNGKIHRLTNFHTDIVSGLLKGNIVLIINGCVRIGGCQITQGAVGAGYEVIAKL